MSPKVFASEAKKRKIVLVRRITVFRDGDKVVFNDESEYDLSDFEWYDFESTDILDGRGSNSCLHCFVVKLDGSIDCESVADRF